MNKVWIVVGWETEDTHYPMAESEWFVGAFLNERLAREHCVLLNAAVIDHNRIMYEYDTRGDDWGAPQEMVVDALASFSLLRELDPGVEDHCAGRQVFYEVKGIPFLSMEPARRHGFDLKGDPLPNLPTGKRALQID